MFENQGKEDGIYSLITIEIVKHKRKIIISFQKDAKTSKLDSHFQLIEDIVVLCKDENQSPQHLYG